jgi:hypothetical protein
MRVVLYNPAHIGDMYFNQQILIQFIRCNPTVDIKIFHEYNHYMYNDISNNLIINAEDYNNSFFDDFKEKILPHMQLPSTHTFVVNKDILFVNTWIASLGVFLPCVSMGIDVIPIQYGFMNKIHSINQQFNLSLQYTPLSLFNLIPYIPKTNIDKFLTWKQQTNKKLIFYYNYFPCSGQDFPLKNPAEEHSDILKYMATKYPDSYILVPNLNSDYTPQCDLSQIPNIINCSTMFDCQEILSCENIYKLTYISSLCDLTIVFDMGRSFTFYNQAFAQYKNKIIHIISTDTYYGIFKSHFNHLDIDLSRYIGVKCKSAEDVINYFSTPLISEWIQIQRKQGYGASFNNLYLRDAMIKKEAKNEYGVKKIQKEIIFYKFVQEHKCCPVTEFIESTDTSYTMKYLPKHTPLFQVFPFFTETKKTDILQKIDSHLQRLHETEIKFISKEHYQKALQIEMFEKLEKRYEEVKEILSEYAFIKTVNSVPIRTFQENLDRLQQALNEFIKTQIHFKFNPIHGDCQFNNILYNEETDDLVFIDPRGYFGDNDLYGLAEYDFAKVLFALSGYDAFDAREVKGLNVNGSNIMLEIPTLVPEPLAQTKNRFLSQLVVSIWMGNAHCFKENKFKTAYSYFIAMYYASLYL